MINKAPLHMALVGVLSTKNQQILLRADMLLHRLVFHEKERHPIKELPDISIGGIDNSHQTDINLG